MEVSGQREGRQGSRICWQERSKDFQGNNSSKGRTAVFKFKGALLENTTGEQHGACYLDISLAQSLWTSQGEIQ